MKIYTYPSTAAEKRINTIMNRVLEVKPKEHKSVIRILADVKKNGINP